MGLSKKTRDDKPRVIVDTGPRNGAAASGDRAPMLRETASKIQSWLEPSAEVDHPVLHMFQRDPRTSLGHTRQQQLSKVLDCVCWIRFESVRLLEKRPCASTQHSTSKTTHQTCKVHRFSQRWWFLVLEVQSFNGRRDLTIHPPVV